MKIDVIIPSYNGLPYLKEAVESVLEQTHKDLALYVVDDGSTDKTKNFVDGLTDHRIHYLPKKNGGLSSARNYGIEHSASPLIALLDADDLWRADKLEKQLALLERNPSLGLIYSFQERIDQDGKKLSTREAHMRGRVFVELLYGNEITGSGSAVLIRREAFDKVGLFREDFRIGEDWEMWLRIAKEYEVDFVPEYLVSIRIHGASMQQNHQKMADGLAHMFSVMTKEFGLTGGQRRTLARYCLREAVHQYYLADSPETARTLLRLLREDPVMLVYPWKWFGYARFFLGKTRTQAFKHLLLGPNDARIAEGVAELDRAHVLYMENDPKSRRLLLSTLSKHPRFFLYITKWLFYLKLIIGRGVVKQIKLTIGKGDSK